MVILKTMESVLVGCNTCIYQMAYFTPEEVSFSTFVHNQGRKKKQHEKRSDSSIGDGIHTVI